ncbi:MAG: caspase family protein, partial [Proteobacteria bacterium]|nr:caspase family protein [Pseudomonadota bacterium]
KAFGFVRDDVLKVTNNRQEPYVQGSLGGEDVPLVPAKQAAPVATSAPASEPRSDIRRDYELALQLGTRSAWESFRNAYPSGFYADLAKGQLDKLAAEEARLAATEKAHAAQDAKARLAAEGAKQAELAKAETNAKAAEDERIAAEKIKEIEQAKADAAERVRAAAEKNAVSGSMAVAANTQDRSSGQPGAPASTGASVSMPPAVPDLAQNQKTAALSPPTEPAAKPALSAIDITKSVQTELRRVGCYTGSADGDWDKASRTSLEKFNRYADTKLNVKIASLDTLDVIKGKTARVCPLICRHGFKADDNACVKITCGEGKILNDDNECVARRERKTPSASREREERRPRRADPRYYDDEMDTPPVAAPRRPSRVGASRPSGQIVCGDHSCRQVRPGCHIEFRTTSQGGSAMGGGSNVEICN